MLFETNGLNLHNVDLLGEELGDTWLSFKKCITDYNTNIFKESFNLIKISLPETTLGMQINGVLINESLTVTEQIYEIRSMLITNIIDIAVQMGIKIDVDATTIDSLPILTNIVDAVYTLDGYEDLLSLSAILEDKDTHPVDRFISLLETIYNIDDLSYYENLIMEVSEYTLETIRLSLISPDATVEVPNEVKTRVIANKAFLKDTLAAFHVTHGGNMGGSFATLLNTFQSDLPELRESDPKRYIKELVGLSLLSDISNGGLVDELSTRITTDFQDAQLLFYADDVIKQLNLG